MEVEMKVEMEVEGPVVDSIRGRRMLYSGTMSLSGKCAQTINGKLTIQIVWKGRCIGSGVVHCVS